MKLKNELAQDLPTRGRRSAPSRAGLIRAVVLSLICAGAALVWSTTQASADPAQNLGSAVTGDVTTTVHSVLGSHRSASGWLPAHGDVTAGAGRTAVGAAHREDVTKSVGDVVQSAGNTTDSVASTLDATTKIVNNVDHPDRLGSSVGGGVKRATAAVGTSTDSVRATGSVVTTTGRTVSRLGGDHSRPVGAVLGDVGGAVTSVGGTVDGVGKTTGDATTGLGNAAGTTVTTTIDHTVGETLTKVTAGVTATVTTRVKTTVGTATGRVGTTIGSVGTTVATGATVDPVTSPERVQPGATVRQRSEQLLAKTPAGAEPIRQVQQLRPVTATVDRTGAAEPAVAALTNRPGSGTAGALLILISDHGSGPGATGHRGSSALAQQSQVPAMTGASLIGTGGATPAPAPGQIPTPSGAVATSCAASGSWHEHAVLPSATDGRSARLLEARGSSLGSAAASTYDPGFSPD